MPSLKVISSHALSFCWRLDANLIDPGEAFSKMDPRRSLSSTSSVGRPATWAR